MVRTQAADEADEGNALGAIGVSLHHIGDMLEDILARMDRQGEQIQELRSLVQKEPGRDDANQPTGPTSRGRGD